MCGAQYERKQLNYLLLGLSHLTETFLFPQIEFPDKHWLPEHMLPDLERLLPGRDHVMMSDDMEEVDLCEVDYERQKRNHSGEAYDEDEGPRHGGVQCQTQ